MAALSQTAGSVAVGSATTPIRRVQYGESVTQGQPLYLNTDGKYYRCLKNGTAIQARCAAIALTPGGMDSFGIAALPGTEPEQSLVNLGATLAVGTVYAVSTVGAIEPISDSATTNYVTTIGIASTAALLDFQVAISNKQKA